MPHQLRHPASARIGEPHHIFELLGTVLGLHRVSFLPSRSAFSYRSSEIDTRAAVNLQLLQSLVEFFFSQIRESALFFDRKRLRTERREDFVQVLAPADNRD